MAKGGKGLLILVFVIVVLGAVLVGAGVFLAGRGTRRFPGRRSSRWTSSGNPRDAPDDPFAVFGGAKPSRSATSSTRSRRPGTTARRRPPSRGWRRADRLRRVQEIRDAVKPSGRRRSSRWPTRRRSASSDPARRLLPRDRLRRDLAAALGRPRPERPRRREPFLRGTLDKLGVKPEFGQRHEFKNAMNLFTETKFTEAHRRRRGSTSSRSTGRW